MVVLLSVSEVCRWIVGAEGETDRANKPCHPNPTALVGNWLTGRGEVIEVMKVR